MPDSQPYSPQEAPPSSSAARAGNGGGGGDDEGQPPYSDYQVSIYTQGAMTGAAPAITCDSTKWESLAREKMDPKAFAYVFGGAGTQATVAANQKAFAEDVRLVPRFLRPTDGPIVRGNGPEGSGPQGGGGGGGGDAGAMPGMGVKRGRDLSIELFGKRYPTPIIMAPVGVQEIWHPDGEIAAARACASVGVPFTLSTAATRGMGDVAKALGATPGPPPGPAAAGGTNGKEEEKQETPQVFTGGCPRIFQLYWPLSPELTGSLLRRAWAAGYEHLMVTLDTFAMAWRPLDLDTAYLPFAAGQGCQVGFEDPVFRSQLEAELGTTPEESPLMAARLWLGQAFSGHAHTWDDLALLRSQWPGKILLKGVLDPRDAELACASPYVDGLIVSNHGGRQLDGSVSALEMLPAVVRSVAGRMPVLFDSGVRSGTDVAKALCLGAAAVLVGRPVIYGLGLGGQEGAAHVLRCLLAELDLTMGLAGVKRVGELERSMVRLRSGGWVGAERSLL